MKVVCVNFRCMANMEVRIGKGMVLLNGDSGRGKTTVLESLLYAFYGSMRGQYTHGQKSCTVSISIEPDIVVQRNSGPARLTLQVGGQKYDGANAQEIINNLFGDENIFIAGCYSQQGERCALLTGSNDDKMKLLRAISFRQDKVEEVQARLSAALKDVQSRMVHVERDFLVSQRSLEGYRASNPDIDISNLNIEDISVDDLNAEIKVYEATIKTHEVNIKTVLQLESKVTTLESITLDDNVASPDDQIFQVKCEIATLIDLDYRISTQLNDIAIQAGIQATLSKQFEEIATLKQDLTTLDAEHDIVESNIESEMERIVSNREASASFSTALKEYEVSSVGELRRKVGELGGKVEELKTQMKDTQLDLDALKWNQSQVATLKCPACQVALCLEDHTLKLSDLQVKFEPKPVKNPDVNEEMLSSLRRQISDVEALRAKIQSNLASLTKTSLTIQEETPTDTAKFLAMQKRKTITERLKILEPNQATQHIVKVELSKEDLTTSLADVKAKLDVVYTRLRDLENQKSQLEANSKRRQTLNLARLELAGRTSASLESEVETLRQKLVETKDMRDLAISIIRKSELEAQFSRDKKNLDSLSRRYEKIKEFHNLAKQTEISILERSVQVLNEQVNQFLSVMFPDEDRMTVRFSTTKETKTGKERMTCSVSIFYKNVYYDGYKQLSRGEGDRVSLAIMLAINSLTDGKFILLDETLNTLDSNSKLQILSMLKTFAGDKKRCIIASHDIVEGVFDHILNF